MASWPAVRFAGIQAGWHTGRLALAYRQAGIQAGLKAGRKAGQQSGWQTGEQGQSSWQAGIQAGWHTCRLASRQAG
jgi:hypothetical protein